MGLPSRIHEDVTRASFTDWASKRFPFPVALDYDFIPTPPPGPHLPPGRAVVSSPRSSPPRRTALAAGRPNAQPGPLSPPESRAPCVEMIAPEINLTHVSAG